jgi:hypothetical protein
MWDKIHDATGTSRIYLIYLSKADKDRKTDIEIVHTAFTDHHAVVLRLSTPAPEKRRRKGRWKMGPDIVQESTFKAKFQTEWEKWRGHKRYYPDVGMWWERHVQKNIKQLARHTKSWRTISTSIYDILKANIPEANCQPCRNTKQK